MSGGAIERSGAGPAAGITATQGAHGTSIARSGETASAAMAEAARANVLARFYQARQLPRDTLEVRARVLLECERPRLAELAVYSLPRGKTPDGRPNYITGPSIRLAEAFLRTWGNLHVESPIVYEDDAKRVITVTVTDLETNATLSDGIIVEKVVEKRNVRDRAEVIGERTNSEGKKVYLVRANETDLLAKQNALKSKALRNLVFRLVPGDMVDEAMEVAARVNREGAKKDPLAAAKKIADAFLELNVLPSQLAEALGHALDRATVADVELMRGWYAAIKSGEASVNDVLVAPKKPEPEAPASQTSKIASAARKLTAEERAAMIERGEDPNAG